MGNLLIPYRTQALLNVGGFPLMKDEFCEFINNQPFFYVGTVIVLIGHENELSKFAKCTQAGRIRAER